jgi:2-methylcitrate dehydratase PrpD
MALSSADGVAFRVAEAISRRSGEDLEDGVLRATRNRVLHSVGVALIGTGFEPFGVAAGSFSPEGGTTPLFNRPAHYAPADAAFANAVAAHSSLQEDCGPGGFEEGSHPGTYVVPAALAAAHATHADGRLLVRGLVAGYEAVGILGRMTPKGLGARRFRPVGVMGPFGAAAAVSVILGADVEELAAAIAIASNLAGGSSQGFVNGTMEPYFHAGFGARNGYLAASLAHAGASASGDALEGDFGFFHVYAGEDRTMTSRTEEAAITRPGSKKYAVCLQNQESLELASELRPAVGDALPTAVVLRRPQTSANGTGSPGVGSGGPYLTMLQRQMSARFSVAAALLGRPVDDPRYFFDAQSDHEVAELADRVTLETSEADVIDLEVTVGGEVARVSGRRPEILFPDAATTERRFADRAASVLGSERAATALEAIRELEQLDDAAALVEMLA